MGLVLLTKDFSVNPEVHISTPMLKVKIVECIEYSNNSDSRLSSFVYCKLKNDFQKKEKFSRAVQIIMHLVI